MITSMIEPSFDAWRDKARFLLRQGARPEDIDWCDAEEGVGLLAETGMAYQASQRPAIKVPEEFISLARNVCAHTDRRRFAILYRLLHRLTLGGERHLLNAPSDSDMRQCQMWAKAVGRDIHKMHAFVRFRLVGTDSESGREQFVAWFEPMFRIVRLATPFFERRFAGMDWSILTPDECAHWDGTRLTFSPGVSGREVPDADAQDDLWRTYYRSIFNPARLKVKAMQSEMPMKYWKNLPEAEIIESLIDQSGERVQRMIDSPERPVKPLPPNKYLESLKKRAR